jgi:hypothetical protein
MEVEGSTEAAAFTEVAVTGNSVQVPPKQSNDMENVTHANETCEA